MRARLLAVVVVAMLGTPALATAPDASQLCEAAIAQAARKHDVPHRVLAAIGLVESGRTRDGRRAPWPWTVNVAGEGRYFESRAEALTFVEARRAAGARSFDVGCMQVNHRYHGHAFASVEAMLDPAANADYAARFLAELHAETGDWMRAAGYYHSRTREPFERYSKLIGAAYAKLADLPTPTALAAEAAALAEAPATPAAPAAPRRADPAAPTLFSGLLRLAAPPKAAPAPITAGGVALAMLPRAAGALSPTPEHPGSLFVARRATPLD